MTHGVFGISAAALSTAAFVLLSPLPAAWADATGPAAANGAEPSLGEPAPTPGWAEGGPTSNAKAATPDLRRPHAVARHVAWRNERRHVRASTNPVADAATGVVGGVADLGSVAAYPFYCFPNYGSCSVRVPYRF